MIPAILLGAVGLPLLVGVAAVLWAFAVVLRERAPTVFWLLVVAVVGACAGGLS